MATFLWVLLGVILTLIGLAVARVVITLIKKPNLRYYLLATLKDVKHMYYRYHV